MKSLLVQLGTAINLIGSGESEGALEEIEDLRDILSSALANYEDVCEKHGIGLPYNSQI